MIGRAPLPAGRPVVAASEATIGGRPARLAEAIEAAASLLSRARLPVIAGLSADVAAAQAAVRLGWALRGVVDHVRSRAALADLGVMREVGWIVTSPLEARKRADLLLLVGPGIGQAWPEIGPRLLDPGAPSRRVIRLCPGRRSDGLAPDAEAIGTRPVELVGTLGVVRALVAGRAVNETGARRRQLTDCAKALTAARYGVAVWSAAALDPLVIEILCGLIEDLNSKTRFVGLPLAPSDNAAGAAQAAGWLTGFPFPVGFGRGVPEHDPWRFDAVRLVDSGEADAALWLACSDPEPPSWRRSLPLVAITAPGSRPAPAAEVAITVGHPAIDHDAVLFDPRIGGLATCPATAPSAAPRAAEVLARIEVAAQADRTSGESPC